MNNICLIGYMGSGKTTVGKLLAGELSLELKDTDAMIVSEQGRKIPNIFKEEGEPYFRDLEHKLLLKLYESGLKDTVLSTGGGLPMAESNRPLLKKIGTVIYLKGSPECLYERVRDDKGRPLLDTDDRLARIRDMLKVRGPVYEDVADHIIETDDLSPDQVVKAIVNILKSS